MAFKLHCVGVLFPRKLDLVLKNKITYCSSRNIGQPTTEDNLSLLNPKIRLSGVAPERELDERTVGTWYTKTNQTEQESETGMRIGSRRDSGQILGVYRPILIKLDSSL